MLSETSSAADRNSTESQVVPLRTESHPYRNDPYLRSLAIAQSTCFGAHSEQSDACKVCRLNSECQNAVVVRLAEIAAQEIAREEHEQEIQRQKKLKAENQGKAVDELNSVYTQGSRRKIQPGDNCQEYSANKESHCLHCSTVIKAGSQVIWIRDVGMFHVNCVEPLERSP